MKRKGLTYVIIFAIILSMFSTNVLANNENSQNFNAETQNKNVDLVVFSKNIETDIVTRHEYSFPIEESNSITSELSSEGYIGVLPSQTKTTLPNNINSPRQLIGNDTRYSITTTNVFPYRAICRTATHWDSDGDGDIDTVTGGTGFLIGPNIILTAGHVVYKSNRNGWCEYVEVFFPGNNAIIASSVYTNSGWTDDADINLDWGVIEINNNIGNTLGWFGKKVVTSSMVNSSVEVIGYPGDKDFGTMWGGTGKITSTTNRIEHTVDTFEGQSGSPILNSSNQVLGVHCGGTTSKGYGVKMTTNLYNYLETLN